MRLLRIIACLVIVCLQGCAILFPPSAPERPGVIANPVDKAPYDGWLYTIPAAVFVPPADARALAAHRTLLDTLRNLAVDTCSQPFATNVAARTTDIPVRPVVMHFHDDPETLEPKLVAIFHADRGSNLIKQIISSASRNYLNEPTVSDPRFDEQWALQSSGDKDINGPQGWNIVGNGTGVVIGLLDTGVDLDHRDLQGRIWTNLGEIPDNNLDDDGNGYVDDVSGINVLQSTLCETNCPAGSVQDDNGHGTWMAGIIAAATDNHLDIAGVAGMTNTSVAVCKFLDEHGIGDTCGAIRCLEYFGKLKTPDDVDKKRYRIMATNNSWGGAGNNPHLLAAIQAQACPNDGILFIAAAGNQGKSIDNNPFYPASYDSPNILSVAAVNREFKLWYDSSYGRNVEVAAPGSAIRTLRLTANCGATNNCDRTVQMRSGTSVATAHVSGLVALLAAHNTSAKWVDIRNRVISAGTVTAPDVETPPTMPSVPKLDADWLSQRVIRAAANAGECPGDSPCPGSLTCKDQKIARIRRGKGGRTEIVSINCGAPQPLSIKPQLHKKKPNNTFEPGVDADIVDDGTSNDTLANDGVYVVKPGAAKGVHKLTLPGDELEVDFK